MSSGWAEVLHVRELAICAAAINSLCSLGAFAMPFAWGAARDATGTFTIGLIAFDPVLADVRRPDDASRRRSKGPTQDNSGPGLSEPGHHE